MKVAVIGYRGMVGSTVYKWFKDEKKLKVCGIDVEDSTHTWDEVNKIADAIFVCVPTPFNWKTHQVDLSILNAVVDKVEDGKIVVVKSTVPIGTTNVLQRKRKKVYFMFNPEFLSERTAWADFTNPDRQFLGYTRRSHRYCHQVMEILPESPGDYFLPASEAELLKYINNLHGMLEIMESNHYWEVCQKEGLDYKRVRKCMTASRWVGCPMGRHYRKIWHNGKRGYGGKCFPKDMNNYLQYCHESGVDARLFKAVNEMNQRILAQQDLSETEAEQITYKNPRV